MENPRSMLFVPAHKEKLVLKALDSKADVLIFDLEDSCPDSEQGKGMSMIKRYIRPKDYVRINNRTDIILLEDKVQNFLVPKAESAFDVKDYHNIMALVESCKGVINLKEILELPNVIGVAFGSEDYKADLMGEGIEFARDMIVTACKAYGKIPIDTVHTNVHDLVDLEHELIESKKRGFEGMLCLHPKELDLVHRYYTPTKEEIDLARQQVELYEGSDGGVAILHGVYVAPPMYKRAKKLIKRYEIFCWADNQTP